MRLPFAVVLMKSSIVFDMLSILGYLYGYVLYTQYSQMVTFMLEMINQTFALGFGLGLFICAIFLLNLYIRYRTLKTENATLKQHLHIQMEIDSDANEYRKKELEKLKEENANLRDNIQTLMQKPGKQELKLLYIYDKAINMMMERSPGFGPAWQMIFREAEEEISRSLKGFIPFIKRVIRPSSQGLITDGGRSSDSNSNNKE